jgi:hypothetical protein
LAGSAYRRELEIGIRRTREVEILSAIDEENRIVAPFPNDLRDGTRVNLRADWSSAPGPRCPADPPRQAWPQNLVAILGVAVSVGFSMAMAALIQGTHHDFIA